MPPSGLDIIASVIMTLRDEIASFKAEVLEHSTPTQRDVRSMEHVVTIKQDIDAIENFIMNFAIIKGGNSHKIA